MNKKLTRKFYTQPTLTVAKQMLGKYLIHCPSTDSGRRAAKRLVGKIVETEAYVGPKDKASHAFGNKKTERNKAEWLIGGHIYIYLVYGMYWQFNISTGKADYPECVLIRALEPISPKSYALNPKIANGPGKLCRWMGLDKSFYGIDMVTSKKIYLTEGEPVKPSQIVASKRINIDYAQEWAGKLWRFYIKNNPFISQT